VILSEGCDDYVRKPFREHELFEILEEHLGVEFVYQDVAPSPTLSGSYREALSALQIQEEAEFFMRLGALPEAWREGLERAAILGSMDRLIESIEEIRDADPEFADLLSAWARGYQHDKIIAALREAR
jgi:hypothetical protein